jgi:hypothetical protein
MAAEVGVSNPSRLCEVLSEEFLEGGAGPKQKAFHRTHGDFQDSSDFLIGKVLVAPEDHGGALVFGKLLKCGIDGLV